MPDARTSCASDRHNPLIYFPDDVFTADQLKNGAVVLHFLCMLYCMFAIAILNTRFFFPSLKALGRRLCLSESMYKNFLAFGQAMPLIMLSFVGVFFAESRDLGLATMMGAVAFHSLVLPLVCAWRQRSPLRLTRWLLVRDTVVYLVALSAVLFMGADNLVRFWEALILLALYALYLCFVHFDEDVAFCVADGMEQVDRPRSKPSNRRASIILLVESQAFDVLMLLIVLANLIILVLEAMPSTEHDHAFATAHTVLNAVFVSEMVLKIYALGFFGYWRDVYNAFDGFLTWLIVIELVLENIGGEGSGRVANVLRFVRVLRALRTIRLAKLLLRPKSPSSTRSSSRLSLHKKRSRLPLIQRSHTHQHPPARHQANHHSNSNNNKSHSHNSHSPDQVSHSPSRARSLFNLHASRPAARFDDADEKLHEHKAESKGQDMRSRDQSKRRDRSRERSRDQEKGKDKDKGKDADGDDVDDEGEAWLFAQADAILSRYHCRLDAQGQGVVIEGQRQREGEGEGEAGGGGGGGVGEEMAMMMEMMMMMSDDSEVKVPGERVVLATDDTLRLGEHNDGHHDRRVSITIDRDGNHSSLREVKQPSPFQELMPASQRGSRSLAPGADLDLDSLRHAQHEFKSSTMPRHAHSPLSRRPSSSSLHDSTPELFTSLTTSSSSSLCSASTALRLLASPFLLPMRLTIYFPSPSPSSSSPIPLLCLSLLCSLCWLFGLVYVMVWMAATLSVVWAVDVSLVGLSFLAVGLMLPELWLNVKWVDRLNIRERIVRQLKVNRTLRPRQQNQQQQHHHHQHQQPQLRGQQNHAHSVPGAWMDAPHSSSPHSLSPSSSSSSSSFPRFEPHSPVGLSDGIQSTRIAQRRRTGGDHGGGDTHSRAERHLTPSSRQLLMSSRYPHRPHLKAKLSRLPPTSRHAIIAHMASMLQPSSRHHRLLSSMLERHIVALFLGMGFPWLLGTLTSIPDVSILSDSILIALITLVAMQAMVLLLWQALDFRLQLRLGCLRRALTRRDRGLAERDSGGYGCSHALVCALMAASALWFSLQFVLVQQKLIYLHCKD